MCDEASEQLVVALHEVTDVVVDAEFERARHAGQGVVAADREDQVECSCVPSSRCRSVSVVARSRWPLSVKYACASAGWWAIVPSTLSAFGRSAVGIG
jgi:hypothetical protein